jgi:hypothetical protein
MVALPYWRVRLFDLEVPQQRLSSNPIHVIDGGIGVKKKKRIAMRVQMRRAAIIVLMA